MVIHASFAGVPEFGEVAVGMEFVSSGPVIRCWLAVVRAAG
jgi:hypothetical protein